MRKVRGCGRRASDTVLMYRISEGLPMLATAVSPSSRLGELANFIWSVTDLLRANHRVGRRLLRDAGRRKVEQSIPRTRITMD